MWQAVVQRLRPGATRVVCVVVDLDERHAVHEAYVPELTAVADRTLSDHGGLRRGRRVDSEVDLEVAWTDVAEGAAADRVRRNAIVGRALTGLEEVGAEGADAQELLGHARDI